MQINFLSKLKQTRTYISLVFSKKALLCLLITIITFFSSSPLAIASSIDRIMEIKGFTKPDVFSVHEEFDGYHNNSNNPLELWDDAEDMILTKVDLDKYKFYTFMGDLDVDNNNYNCIFMNMSILDKRGNSLIESEGSTSNPFIQFNPEKSGIYYLVSSIPYHYGNNSCEYSISEYVGAE